MVAYNAPPRRLVFELREGGERAGFVPWPLTRAVRLVEHVRDEAARGLREHLSNEHDKIDRYLMGRGATNSDKAKRVHIVPIPSVGHHHADMAIRRLAINVPQACPLRSDDLAWAFAQVVWTDDDGIVVRELQFPDEDEPTIGHFTGPARTWRSVTPLALPVGRGSSKTGTARRDRDAGIADAVRCALRHANVRASPLDIRVQREPFHRRGVRAERVAAGSRFSKHALWHVQLRFRETVPGPMVIGDGRFCGLGLMEPVTSYSDAFFFRLDGQQPIAAADRPALVRCLRRALMALARDGAGGVGRLFSGHEQDGRSDRAGHHAHVFLAADGDSGDDGSITRLIVAAPWIVDRRAEPGPGSQCRFFDEVVRRLSELSAGPLGRFDGLVAEPLNDGDPLLGPASLWIGRTPYIATRNLKKRDDPAAVVEADVIMECRRRGLPSPAEVEVLDVGSGPRGGRPAATLKLRFATAIRGPILLGRDSHTGGGLFRAVSCRE